MQVNLTRVVARRDQPDGHAVRSRPLNDRLQECSHGTWDARLARVPCQESQLPVRLAVRCPDSGAVERRDEPAELREDALHPRLRLRRRLQGLLRCRGRWRMVRARRPPRRARREVGCLGDECARRDAVAQILVYHGLVFLHDVCFWGSWEVRSWPVVRR